MILQANRITKYFGGLAALSDLELEVFQGEILALIGPNGAGKTTLFNVVTGYLKPTSGRVFFNGEDITGMPPHLVAKFGMVRTFQATIMFEKSTVMQSMMTAHHLLGRASVCSALFNLRSYRESEKAIERNSLDLLESLGLAEVKDELVVNLPHGSQRALGMAMALAAKPILLLLDEPVTGMNPEETMELMNHIRDIREIWKISILIIEHDMQAVMGFSDRIAVLNFGRKIAEGSPEEIRNNKEVIGAYLGGVGLGDVETGKF